MNHNRKGSFWRGKGFYITLGVCVFTAVAASGLAIRSMVNKLETGQPTSEVTSWNENTEQAGKEQKSVPVLPASPSPSPKQSSSQSSFSGQQGQQKQSATGAAAQTSAFILPVAGQVTAAYSGDELVYNETLADWRTHNGLDITAAAGAEVKAAMAGTVSKIMDDPQWGTVIEVTANDQTLRYCGLSAKVAVGEGALIEQGELLGTLGEIPAESALEPNLHFELLANGRLIDPETLMK